MKQLSVIILLFFISVTCLAQMPQQINYQGVARNAQGQPYANQAIAVRLTIHDIVPTGTVLYSETRNVTTNAFGLFNVAINSSGASSQTGNFSSIDWNRGATYLQTEMDPTGGSNFINIGTTQMQGTPYSLMSKKLALPYLAQDNDLNTLIAVGNNGLGGAIKGFTASYYAIEGITSSNSNYAGVFGKATGNGGAGVRGTSSNAAGVGVEAWHGNGGLALSVVGRLKISGGNTSPADGKVLTSDAAGNATWQYPQTIAFRASGMRDNVKQAFSPYISKKVLFYQQARYNIGDAYDAENSIFFPPVAGVYHLNVQVDWVERYAMSLIQIKLLRGGQITTIAEQTTGTTSLEAPEGFTSPSLVLDIALQPADAVWVIMTQLALEDETASLSPEGYKCWFTGHLVTRL